MTTEDELERLAEAEEAADELAEQALERGDTEELQRLFAAGNEGAGVLLPELAEARRDVDELRRLAAAGAVSADVRLRKLTAAP